MSDYQLLDLLFTIHPLYMYIICYGVFVFVCVPKSFAVFFVNLCTELYESKLVSLLVFVTGTVLLNKKLFETDLVYCA